MSEAFEERFVQVILNSGGIDVVMTSKTQNGLGFVDFLTENLVN